MLEWIVERLTALLGPISDLGKEKRELRDNALSSISLALTETYLYFTEIDQNKPRDPEKEAELARHWAAASIPMRHIDVQLADTCEYKSQYWVNPDNWSKEKVREMGIGLNVVRERYKAQLKKK